MKIDVPLQPKQKLFYRAVENPNGPVIIGVGGSKGSTKSHALRSVMLIRRLKYPGTAGLIFRRKMKQLRETHLESGYFKQWPFMRKWWKEQTRTIHLPNGSRIVFGIAEHPEDINDFQGHEYMDVFPDEATRLTEIELVKLNETRRWTQNDAIPDRLCKTCLFMNPGGPGHAYIRRLMFEIATKHNKTALKGKERMDDYLYIPMFAWDNFEWSKDALKAKGLIEQCHGKECGSTLCAECVYYSWTDEQRFKFFLKETTRGHELDNLPKRLRTGWLLGEWSEFAGQFYDIWDEERFVHPCQPDRDWHPRWLGIDWGFQHPMSCHWFARVGKVTKIYREKISNHHSARSQAQEIVDMTPKDERKQIDAIYLSPDAFQQRSEQDSFAKLMGEVFRANGMPYPTEADDDRKHGAQCMYDLMKYDEVEIDPSCKGLIEVIPMICTEEDDPEEIEKFEGDDAWDSARYGLKSRQRQGKMPIQEAVEIRVSDFAKSKNKKVEEMDVNSIACLSRRARILEHKKRRHRRGGLGRIWRPQPGYIN